MHDTVNNWTNIIIEKHSFQSQSSMQKYSIAETQDAFKAYEPTMNAEQTLKEEQMIQTCCLQSRTRATSSFKCQMAHKAAMKNKTIAEIQDHMQCSSQQEQYHHSSMWHAHCTKAGRKTNTSLQCRISVSHTTNTFAADEPLIHAGQTRNRTSFTAYESINHTDRTCKQQHISIIQTCIAWTTSRTLITDPHSDVLPAVQKQHARINPLLKCRLSLHTSPSNTQDMQATAHHSIMHGMDNNKNNILIQTFCLTHAGQASKSVSGIQICIILSTTGPTLIVIEKCSLMSKSSIQESIHC